MWHGDDREWRLHQPRFRAAELDPERAAGPWFGHRWFAYDLIAWGRPDVIVELGTHYGPSFFAFCQAVLDAGYPAELHAVDTWEGDEHAGTYGEEVIDTVQHIRAEAYPDLAIHLHRCLFSEALDAFADQSIDLLHIDGFHSYEAVREDFETWLPKVAVNGVVLFHDIDPASGYGSARYWTELTTKFPHRWFPHSFGLGVLFPKGTVAHDGAVLSSEFERWSPYYEAQAGTYFGELTMHAQAQMIDARDEAIAAQARMVDGYAAAARAVEDLVAQRDRELAVLRAEMVASARTSRARTAAVARSISRVNERVAPLRARVTRRDVGADAAQSQEPSAAKRALDATRSALAERLRSRTAAVFDADFYLLTYADVRQAGIDPLWHYRRYGWREQRDPSPLFRTSWYLAENPDVVVAKVDPFRHYLVHGWREDREPSRLFRAAWYAERTPAVRASGVSPLEYYWTTGYAAGDFVHPEQRARVLALPPLERVGPQRVIACTLVSPEGDSRSVSLDDLIGADVDLVTVDLWDTMVARMRPADAGKLATARRMFLDHASALPSDTTPWSLMRHRVDVEARLASEHAHQEYRIDDVLTAVLVEAIALDPDAARAAAVRYASAEMAEEAATTYPIDDVVGFLERLRARATPPKVAVVSDFYASGDALGSVLRACGYDADDLPVFSSSDHLASKRRRGALYELVRREYGVAPNRHLHLGDNPWADGDMQRVTGGWAGVVELSPSPYPGPGELDPEHVRDLVALLRRELRTAAPVLVPDASECDRERRAAQAGVLTAVLPVALVASAIEQAITRGLDRVSYTSREGAFLARVHDAVAHELVDTDAPAARHLEVSRRSTFGASIAEFGHRELARMWSQYADQSPRALFVSLGVDPEPFRPDVAAVGLDLDSVVSGIADDPRVAELLERPAVHDGVSEALAARRERLLAYLDQELDSASDTTVVVDVGWRGTIQDNLARLLPERQFVGVYLGLFPFHNAQPVNATKLAVAVDGNLGQDFAFADPPAAVEAPWTPDLPSPVDYRIGDDGRAEPVYEHEGPRAVRLIVAFQDAAVAAAPIVARWMRVNGLTVAMLGDALHEELREYYERPLGGVADIWFDSSHDDTFGVLNATPYAKRRPPLTLLMDAAVAAGSSARPAPTVEECESQWAAGYRAWLPVHALEVLRDLWGDFGDG